MKRSFLFLVFGLFFSSPVFSATITFTNEIGNDNHDAGDGFCSLREAITMVNSGEVGSYTECTSLVSGNFGDNDTIVLADGVTYSLSIAGINTANLSGDLDVSEPLTITSAGTSTISAEALFDANAPDRILSYTGTGSLTLSHIEFVAGELELHNQNVDRGAALYSNSENANLVIDDCTFHSMIVASNTGVSVEGGVISAISLASVSISNSEFYDNTITPTTLSTSLSGGIIFLEDVPQFNLENSKFYNNTISSDSAEIKGGMIYATQQPSLVEIDHTLLNSSFDSNEITSSSNIQDLGGVLYYEDIPLTINSSSITNNTISNNDASSIFGGVIYHANSDFTLLQSTIANNTTETANGDIHGNLYLTSSMNTVKISFSTLVNNTVSSLNTVTAFGGAIYSALDLDGTALMKANIIQNNYEMITGAITTQRDCYKQDTEFLSFSSLGYNVFSPDTVDNTCITVGELDSAVDGGALEEIELHGGTTFSAKISDDHPAYNLSPDCTDANDTSITTDQRGAPRNDGFCDAGSYEYSEFYPDVDGDGFGDSEASGDTDYNADYVNNNLDCNDDDTTLSPNATELCDGIDNDCDGEQDEDFTDLAESCSVGEGACADTGIYVCSEDGLDVACTATEGEASTEICTDDIDNDCDGETDTADSDCPSTDTDGDGIADDVDNCASEANADQADSDSDGTGNACETSGGSSGGCQLEPSEHTPSSFALMMMLTCSLLFGFRKLNGQSKI